MHNPHLDALKDDILYHLSLATDTHDLPAMFGDVKVNPLVFLCVENGDLSLAVTDTGCVMSSSSCALGAAPGE